MVERLTVNQVVAGSSPAGRVTSKWNMQFPQHNSIFPLIFSGYNSMVE